MSSAYMLHVVAGKLAGHSFEEARNTLLSLFISLCSDEAPIVRRSCCSNLGKYAAVIGESTARDALISCCAKLSKDEQDSVKLLAVDACIQIAQRCKSPTVVSQLYSCALALATDRSWRVRYAAADKYGDLLASFSTPDEHELVDAYVRMLQVRSFFLIFYHCCCC
jgi:serine/threonine-protein phosphatase 2A regulatory subunit A